MPEHLSRGILLTFSIYISELEGLDQTQSLIHRTTDGQVIDGDLPQNALVVNHKQAPERHKGGVTVSANFQHLLVTAVVIIEERESNHTKLPLDSITSSLPDLYATPSSSLSTP